MGAEVSHCVYLYIGSRRGRQRFCDSRTGQHSDSEVVDIFLLNTSQRRVKWLGKMTGRMLLVVMLLVPAGVRDQRLSDDDFFIDVLTKCLAPGRELEDIKRTIDKFLQCPSLADISEKAPQKLKDKLLDEVIGEYCQRKNSVVLCLYPLVATMVECANLERIQPVQLLIHVAERMVEFACSHKEDIGDVYKSNEGMKCMKSWYSSYDFLRCINTMKDKHSQIDSCRGLLYADSLGCLILNEARDCFLDFESDCEDSIFASLMNTFLKHIINSTPCGPLYKEKEEDKIIFLFEPLSSGQLLPANGQYIKLLTIMTVIAIS